ncbi:MAG: hypothetical protein ILO42_05530, partial [Clostridia bacterium]|nr:hypothetical protein [Clostridia bacterium]
LSLLTGNPASEYELRYAAASVGADVPFCLSGGRRICRGIGEKTSEPLKFAPDGGTVLIAKPERGIPTADAFRLLDRLHDGFARGGSGRLESFLETVAPGRPAWEMRPYNIFEEVLPELCPESERMIKLLREYTPAAALTGSGSAVFGIFLDSPSAASARDRLTSEFPGCFTVLTAFAEGGAEARADDSIYYL